MTKKRYAQAEVSPQKPNGSQTDPAVYAATYWRSALRMATLRALVVISALAAVGAIAGAVVLYERLPVAAAALGVLALVVGVFALALNSYTTAVAKATWYQLEQALDKDIDDDGYVGDPTRNVKVGGKEPTEIVLGLPATYPWVIRTNSGWRVSVRCLDDLPTQLLTAKTGMSGGPGVFTFAPKRAGDFDHLELRWHRCQTILAGQHPSGRAYSFAHDLPIHPPMAVLLGRVLQATLAVGQLPQHEIQPQEQSTTRHKIPNTPGLATSNLPLRDAQSSTRPGRSAAWAAAVLFGELDALSHAQTGQRNIALNRTAFALGRLIGARLLDRTDVEVYLETSALGLGLDPIEIRDTIKSGLDVGEAQPRNAPEFRAQN